ncbi:hypothetical protein ACPOL_6753 (plasmid) [Acidisarcina polymorpha]|uniref:Uncharacterized protein n=1 Tax=Acidisarcina polymorpha TaxID=2211140 RepID=A0A2Z5G9N8_9BACT|nr:hypothetical protein ACPOL_6753 [Acidisarcina polymorpha]
MFAGGDYLLQVGILVELATVLTRSAGVWFKRGLRESFLFAGAGMVAAAIVAQAISPPNESGLYLWSIRADIFMSMVTCEIFLAMALVLNRQRRPWRREAIAIGQGLTVWALVVLAGQIAQLAMGWPHDMVIFDHIGKFLYLGTLLYWTVTFARPTVEPSFTRQEIEDRASELRERLLYGKRV